MHHAHGIRIHTDQIFHPLEVPSAKTIAMAELIAVGGSDLCGVAIDGTGATFVASRGSGAILAREGA